MKFKPFVTFAIILSSAMIIISGCSKVIPVEQMNMQEAGKFYDNDNYDKALNLYLEILKGEPRAEYTIKAHYRCAEIYKNKENWDEAVAHYNKVIELAPAGYLGSKSKSSVAEIRDYRKQIAENDRIYKNLRRDEEGKPITEAEYKKGAEALFQIARAYENLKIYNRAIHYYSKLVKEFPKYGKAAQSQYQIGNIYFYKLYDYEGGWPHYRKLIEDYPDSFEADKAAKLLKETENTLNNIQQDMKDVDKYASKKALEYRERGRDVSSGEIYGVFADRVAQDYTNIAKGWIDLKNYPNAIRAYEELAKELSVKKFESAEALFQVAKLYQQDGQYQNAIKAYDKLFERNPESPRRNEAIYKQAVCYQAISEWEKAYKGFKTYLGFPKDQTDEDLYREAKQKTRLMEMDQDGDGFMSYQEQEASTSDRDANDHP